MASEGRLAPTLKIKKPKEQATAPPNRWLLEFPDIVEEKTWGPAPSKESH